MTTGVISRTDAARSHQAGLQHLQGATARRLHSEWAEVDRDSIRASWTERLPRMVSIVTAGQAAAAGRADGYLDRVAGNAGAVGRVVPGAFAGVASDGRPLGTLLLRPMALTLARLAGGEQVGRAMAMGLASLDIVGRTQVGDAGRMADQAAIASRRTIGAYTRVVEPDACSRCVVLAGRRYQWDQAFLRHPQCACTHEIVPPSEAADPADPRAVFDQMDRATQDKRFGKDGAEAIREGADISQVVNSRRGISSASDGRHTSEATTRRGDAGRQLGGRPRLTAEAIIRESSSREQAIELLGEHGYIR